MSVISWIQEHPHEHEREHTRAPPSPQTARVPEGREWLVTARGSWVIWNSGNHLPSGGQKIWEGRRIRDDMFGLGPGLLLVSPSGIPTMAAACVIGCYFVALGLLALLAPEVRGFRSRLYVCVYVCGVCVCVLFPGVCTHTVRTWKKTHERLNLSCHAKCFLCHTYRKLTKIWKQFLYTGNHANYNRTKQFPIWIHTAPQSLTKSFRVYL